MFKGIGNNRHWLRFRLRLNNRPLISHPSLAGFRSLVTGISLITLGMMTRLLSARELHFIPISHLGISRSRVSALALALFSLAILYVNTVSFKVFIIIIIIIIINNKKKKNNDNFISTRIGRVGSWPVYFWRCASRSGLASMYSRGSELSSSTVKTSNSSLSPYITVVGTRESDPLCTYLCFSCSVPQGCNVAIGGAISVVCSMLSGLTS